MVKSGIVLRVPGPWSDPIALANAVAKASAGAAELDLEPFDPDLQRAMFVGSGRSLADTTNAAIAAHKSIACLSFAKTPRGIEKIVADTVSALRELGGFAVNVPKSGLSHGWDRWEQIMASPSPDALLQALVLQVTDRRADQLCSFGMKQFDQADACVMRDGTSTQAAWVLFEFNRYSWVEKPDLKTGNTFSRNQPGATMYKLGLKQDRRYAVAHDFFNPTGVWELMPIAVRR